MSGETRLVRGAVAWGALAAIPASTLTSVARGPDAGLSVLLAAGIVLANAALAAAISAFAGRLSTLTAAFVSLPSFAFRMLGILAALSALKGRAFVDEPAFALSFGLAVVAVLALEAASWKRTPWIALTMTKEQP